MCSSQLVDGFRVFYVKYLATSAVVRQLFIKQHKVREVSQAKPAERTLFVINIPVFVDAKCLERVLAPFGQIDHIIFHDKPNSSEPIKQSSKYFVDQESDKLNGFKVAYVVFAEKSSLEQVMRYESSEQNASVLSSSKGHLVGLELWKKQYNDGIVNVKELQKEVDTFMSEYDKRIEEEREKAKDSSGVADEEGWIKVTRHGKHAFLPNKEASDSKIVERMNRKKRDKQVNNFYTFQIRSNKLEQLTQLKKKFEEDKKRIAILKASRRFKPF